MFLDGNKIKNRGFTLVELMVVVSIIVLLSSLVLASLVSAKNNANRTKIAQGLLQVQNALEVYRLKNGYYPKELDALPGAFSISVAGGDQITSQMIGFVPKYINVLPGVTGNNTWLYYNSLRAAQDAALGIKCGGPGGLVPKGYEIVYMEWDILQGNLSLPLRYGSFTDTYTTGGYCLTAQ